MPDDFSKWLAAQSAGGAGQRDVKVRTVGASVARAAAPDSRVISFQFSDQTVARDGHTIATDGWDLGNFLANPVFLWCHESSNPPVGKVVSIGAQGSRLCGDVEFADSETYPFADTIFRLYRGGFLNACSVSWLPISWSYSSDKARAGGIDFKRQEMLEISAVPVPAAPTALATARSAGIDTGPLYEWAERVLDGGDRILIPRGEIEQLRREARMPSYRNGNSSATSDDHSEILAILNEVSSSAIDEMAEGLIEQIDQSGEDIPQENKKIAKETMLDVAKACKKSLLTSVSSRTFDPNQPRDEDGKFAGGGGGGSASGKSKWEDKAWKEFAKQDFKANVKKAVTGAVMVAAGSLMTAIVPVSAPVSATVATVGVGMIASALPTIADHALSKLDLHINDHMSIMHSFVSAVDAMETAVKNEFTASPEDLKAAMDASREANFEHPKAVKMKIRTLSKDFGKRGLYEVSWLASILSDLGYVTDCAAMEADWEGDGSKVPAMLQDALKQLGAALVAMTVEEVAELLASSDAPGEEGAEEMVEMRAAGLRRAALRRLRRLDPAALSAVNSAMAAHLRGEAVAFSRAKAAPVAFKRAGKVLSSESASRLEEIHGAAESCRAMLRSFIDEACGDPQDDTQDPGDTNADDAEARALRARRARARRHAFTAA
jgi:hypothetical protein